MALKLYVSPRAPSPRRVLMFLAEKGLDPRQDNALGLSLVSIDLTRSEHRQPGFVAISPQSKVPVLVLDDGRALGETRAICTWLEGRLPEPNLLGVDAEERAFIEAADRRMELGLLAGIANWVRHCHPGLAPLEQPQFPDFGASQGEKVREGVMRWLDAELARQPFVAGERFTNADITAFVAMEFARGLMKFRPGEHGLPHLQAWRDRVAARPSTSAGA